MPKDVSCIENLKVLPLAPDDVTKAAVKQANEWYKGTTAFSSARGCAVLAVAEYIVNGQGFSLYGRPS